MGASNMAGIPLIMDEPRGKPLCTFVFAHGAGAGLRSQFMEEMAHALSDSSILVIRFNFPYMQGAEKAGGAMRRGRPDPPGVLQKTWMDVVAQIGDPASLVIGGKSMGGRIASMVADRLGVRGLVCMGYPFHPAGAPKTLRTAHLADLKTPTLILQGTRDSLGSREDVAGYNLSPAIRVIFLEDGDHSFKPRKSSGRTYEENFSRAVEEMVKFCGGLLGG